MFLIAGLAGFVIAILWALFYRGPKLAHIPAADLTEIHRGDVADVPHVGFRQARMAAALPDIPGHVRWLLRRRLYLLALRHMAARLSRERPTPEYCLRGLLVGGAVERRLPRRPRWGIHIALARRARMSRRRSLQNSDHSRSACGGSILRSQVPSPAMFMSRSCLIACGLFAANVSSSCGWALAAVIAPPNAVATLEAIQNVGGSVGGALAPFPTGALLQSSNSFVPAFVLGGVISVACAFVYHFATEMEISPLE